MFRNGWQALNKYSPHFKVAVILQLFFFGSIKRLYKKAVARPGHFFNSSDEGTEHKDTKRVNVSSIFFKSKISLVYKPKENNKKEAQHKGFEIA